MGFPTQPCDQRSCTIRSVTLSLLILAWGPQLRARADDAPTRRRPASAAEMFQDYLRRETVRLRDGWLAEIKNLDDWNSRKEEYRRQLFEMLGLDPLPFRTDLQTRVEGRIEQDDFVVERIQFQSRPGLYVTGNLYLPATVDAPLPTILYLCGHGAVKKGDVSYGNKVHYQHHGIWFARHGYACFVIDSLQLGEIEGIHHGTYRYDMWWWLSRGYTPAGVEAWNCIRALDYLQTRPEVDASRIGCSGRSGGGAYSWWIAAIDERIKVAAPVAGITDLENHVVDGCVDGHCDCMYMVNTYQWDYPLVAALVAPRPLLIANTDRDTIFPVDGVYRTYRQARRIYELHGAGEKLALNITAGPHKDTQELQIHALRWFDQHLRQSDRLIERAAVRLLEPESLRVFAAHPEDQRNTRIQESFVAKAPEPELPTNAADWAAESERWRRTLREKVFRAWPESAPSARPNHGPPLVDLRARHLRLRAWDCESEPGIWIRLYGLTVDQPDTDRRNSGSVRMVALHQEVWPSFAAELKRRFESLPDEPGGDRNSAGVPERKEAGSGDASNWVMHLFRDLDLKGGSLAFIAPRGVGPGAIDGGAQAETRLRRRLYLIGQTLEGMQVYDLLQGCRALCELLEVGPPHWELVGEGLVPLFVTAVAGDLRRLRLVDRGDEAGAMNRESFLNYERCLGQERLVALALQNADLTVVTRDRDFGGWGTEVGRKLGWERKITVEFEPTPEAARK